MFFANSPKPEKPGARIDKSSGRACWYASYRNAAGKQHFVSTKIRPQREDGADTFGYYMNGVITAGQVLHFLAAH